MPIDASLSDNKCEFFWSVNCKIDIFQGCMFVDGGFENATNYRHFLIMIDLESLYIYMLTDLRISIIAII